MEAIDAIDAAEGGGKGRGVRARAAGWWHGTGRWRANGRWAPPRWAAPVAGAGLGLACGLGYGLAAAPQYAATAYVLVVPQHSGDAQTALGFAQAYGRLTTGPAVLAGAQEAARRPVAALHGAVQSATSPDAPMISVTGTARTGSAAARIADAVAGSLAATGNRTSADTGVRLLVLAHAQPPASPSSPSPVLSAAVGASAGGLLGALALLVRPGRPGRPEDDDGPPAAAAVPAPAREQTRA